MFSFWNLHEVKSIVEEKQSYGITSKRPFTSPYVGPPYKPNDGRP